MAEPVPLLDEPLKRSVQETLLQYRVQPEIARDAAQVELRNFTPKELRAIFNRLRRTGPGLRSFDWGSSPGVVSKLADVLLRNAANVFASTPWLKPPNQLLERSAATGLALCVNAAGQWALREDGYLAISHVWEEGIQADPGDRGIPGAHVQQIIRRIRLAAGDTQWIWLDGLAIPGASRTLTLEEEELKIAIINNLAGIYRRAASVVILDALVMQLQSTDPAEVAVCLVCGKWLTRVWTYQEIYLARKAVVVTGSGYVDFLAMLRRLRALSGNENHMPSIFGSQSSSLDVVVNPADRSPAKYEQLYLTLIRLWGADGQKPSLSQIALSCHRRRTGNDIDYARAFFPVLGLTWRAGLTREEGMELIYNEQRWYAKRLLLMHGSPRSSFVPGWAPSYLTGLSGLPLGPDQPLGDIEWERRGLRRAWFTYKITAQRPTAMKGGLLLVLRISGSEVLCGCKLSSNERAESIRGFQDAISKQSAYMLANEELVFPSRNGLAYVVMLVEQNQEVPTMDEAWVYLTAEVTAMGNTVQQSQEPAKWLLLHESPIGTHDRSGKTFSKLARLLSDEMALRGDQTPLHLAAAAGDEATLHSLLTTPNPNPNPNPPTNIHTLLTARDSRGWTPLHTASHAGHVPAIRLLLSHYPGTPLEYIDTPDATDRTPLMLAADEGHAPAVRALLALGADANRSSRQALCPLNQALVRGQVEAARALLEGGARARGRDQVGFDPLLLVCDKGVEFAEMLFAFGADPAGELVGGASAVHFAARAGNAALVERVLGMGVGVDLPEGGGGGGGGKGVDGVVGETALSRAVEEQREAVIGLLLRHGANPNRLLEREGGWTPVLRAARVGNYEIVKMLLLHQAEADVHAACRPEGWTALHIAAREGHRLVVKLLLQRGWAVDARDAAGATPLQLAEAAGHAPVVDLLRRAGGS